AGAAPAINIGSHISSTLRCASRSNRRLDWTRFRGSSGWAADAKEGPFPTSPYSGHSPMPAGGRDFVQRAAASVPLILSVSSSSSTSGSRWFEPDPSATFARPDTSPQS
ncbi:hypothetical protein, partial [Piscinibacter sp.]|uniref:hypothetical protein n=1 Tax=Piscinibacter sp. TaxID=1903157 RepID=UPI002F41B70C